MCMYGFDTNVSTVKEEVICKAFTLDLLRFLKSKQKDVYSYT